MVKPAKVLINVDGPIVECQTQGDVEVEIIYWDEFDHETNRDQILSENFRDAFPESAKMLDEHRSRTDNFRPAKQKKHLWRWLSHLQFKRKAAPVAP
jgi:hypothetical protein